MRDDGPGFASKTAGIGLTNTRARLERLYGSGYVLQLNNGTQNGAIVTLEIPFRLREAIAYETVGAADG